MSLLSLFLKLNLLSLVITYCLRLFWFRFFFENMKTEWDENCLKDLGLSKKWLWNKINNHVQIIWFCLPPFFYNFAQNSFFHWPKTSLLLTVDAWILFKWQTQCRATGKYVFSPLVSEYCLVFGSAHYTPAHNFQNWVQIQPRNKCGELKTHFRRCSAHIDNLDCL